MTNSNKEAVRRCREKKRAALGLPVKKREAKTAVQIAEASALRARRYREKKKVGLERTAGHRKMRFCKKCAEKKEGIHIEGVVGPDEYGWKYSDEFEQRGRGWSVLCYSCAERSKFEREQERDRAEFEAELRRREEIARWDRERALRSNAKVP